MIDSILNSSGDIKFHCSKITKFLIVKRGDNNPIFSGSPFSVFAFFHPGRALFSKHCFLKANLGSNENMSPWADLLEQNPETLFLYCFE